MDCIAKLREKIINLFINAQKISRLFQWHMPNLKFLLYVRNCTFNGKIMFRTPIKTTHENSKNWFNTHKRV